MIFGRITVIVFLQSGRVFQMDFESWKKWRLFFGENFHIHTDWDSEILNSSTFSQTAEKNKSAIYGTYLCKQGNTYKTFDHYIGALLHSDCDHGLWISAEHWFVLHVVRRAKSKVTFLKFRECIVSMCASAMLQYRGSIQTRDTKMNRSSSVPHI